MAGMFEVIRKEWPTIKGAPWSIGAIVIAVFGAGSIFGGAVVPMAHELFFKPSPAPQVSTPPAPTVAEAPGAQPASPLQAAVTQEPPRRVAAHPRAPIAGPQTVNVGDVSSSGQTGGNTVGYIGSVDQSTPRE